MAEETEVLADGDAAPKKKSKLLYAVLAVCVLAGGGAGVYVVGPMVLGQEAAAAEESDHAPARRRGGHGSSSGPLLYAIENLVLNPSETHGTRFLMVSAAFEVADESLIEEMRGRDAEIRDMLNRTLGQRTVEELTDLSQREVLRDDLKAALESLLHEGAVLKVYLPQFVIQ